MRKMNLYRLLPLVLLLSGIGQSAAAATLTAGGQVRSAGDGTSADGGSWAVYDPAAPATIATGTVGTFQTGVWAGEIGVPLGGPLVGTELVAVVSQDSDSGTAGHRGYYGVTGHVLSGADPAVFGDMTLRPVPVPAVTLEPGYVAHLSWALAISDGSAVDVAGYHVHRSADGILFEQITVEPVNGTTFTDVTFPPDTRHYALTLAFRGVGAPLSPLSANSSAIDGADSDGDTVPDASDNCPVDANLGQENFDSDMLGDVCDPDDDNDGLSDDYETAQGFDPMDQTDADDDADDDGFTNRDEHDAGTDPHRVGSSPRASRLHLYLRAIEGAMTR